jgi:predicted small lipoprotein YifL
MRYLQKPLLILLIIAFLSTTLTSCIAIGPVIRYLNNQHKNKQHKTNTSTEKNNTKIN